jgi:hypothetical protein
MPGALAPRLTGHHHGVGVPVHRQRRTCSSDRLGQVRQLKANTHQRWVEITGGETARVT